MNGEPLRTAQGPWSTGDFPGQALRLLENEVGSVAFIYGTGPHGGLNPGKYVTGGRDDTETELRDRDRMGRILADGVASALNGSEDVPLLEPRFARERLRVPKSSACPVFMVDVAAGRRYHM